MDSTSVIFIVSTISALCVIVYRSLTFSCSIPCLNMSCQKIKVTQTPRSENVQLSEAVVGRGVAQPNAYLV
jgi:hypothetical protein